MEIHQNFYKSALFIKMPIISDKKTINLENYTILTERVVPVNKHTEYVIIR